MVALARLAGHLKRLFHDFLLPEDDGLTVDGLGNAFLRLVDDLLVPRALGDELDGLLVEALGLGVVAFLHLLAGAFKT